MRLALWAAPFFACLFVATYPDLLPLPARKTLLQGDSGAENLLIDAMFDDPDTCSA